MLLIMFNKIELEMGCVLCVLLLSRGLMIHSYIPFIDPKGGVCSIASW
jgi:hypothetical protein